MMRRKTAHAASLPPPERIACQHESVTKSPPACRWRQTRPPTWKEVSMVILWTMAPSSASYLGAYVRWRHLTRDVGHGTVHSPGLRTQ